ncbi:hypothetical protein ACFLIM_36945 [Nonomuraea sp. M3C6]|uniref:Uncharacterized protein n=1 Tax=Nonomuraea marmarensis TaxID=3351344 RepID=A0ABW7AN22_9ACTN
MSQSMRSKGKTGVGLRWVVRRWPWRASVIAWLLVAVPLGLVRGHYSGIYGFSTANYGWLAFTVVGGSGCAWRLAGTPPVYRRLLRPMLAGAIAFVLCAVAVALMGLIFLPDRPLQGGGATEGPLGGALHPLGRALPVAEVVIAVGYLGELAKPLWRAVRQATTRTAGARTDSGNSSSSRSS